MMVWGDGDPGTWEATMTDAIKAGDKCECWVNGRVVVVRIVRVQPFASGVKIVFQNAARPGRMMERYSPHDFRKLPS